MGRQLDRQRVLLGVDERTRGFDRNGDHFGDVDRIHLQLDLALVIRDTSRRSSTSRFNCLTCRLNTSCAHLQLEWHRRVGCKT
jgi:hypothetical protein